MELFEEFYLASKSSGKDRVRKVEQYAALKVKTNLGAYISYHLTNQQNEEVSEFWNEIMEVTWELESKKHESWLRDESNWKPFDFEYYCSLAGENENTSWLVPLFKKKNKCVNYAGFTIFEINEGNSGSNSSTYESIFCPKDGEIIVEVTMKEDGISPQSIRSMEFYSLAIGEIEHEEESDDSEKEIGLMLPPDYTTGRVLMTIEDADAWMKIDRENRMKEYTEEDK